MITRTIIFLIGIPGSLTVWYLLAFYYVESILDLSTWWIWIPFQVGLLFIFVLTYHMWGAINDGNARMTPWQAVLYNFIPGFNVYWLYNTLVGFSQDANSYIKRHHIKANTVPVWLFRSYILLWFASAVPFVGIVTVPLALVCVTGIVVVALRTIAAIKAA